MSALASLLLPSKFLSVRVAVEVIPDRAVADSETGGEAVVGLPCVTPLSDSLPHLAGKFSLGSVPFLESSRTHLGKDLRLAMLKRVSVENKLDGHTTDTEVLANSLTSSSRFVHLMNQRDIHFPQLGNRTTVSFSLSSVPDSILAVLFGCSPAKVFQEVVRRVAIKVTALLALWSRTDKSKQNELMNAPRADFSVGTKFDRFVSSFCQLFHDVGLLRSPSRVASDTDCSRQGEDTSLVGDVVVLVRPRNVPPAFEGTVRASKGCFVELRSEGLFAHNHFPSMVPWKKNGAGGRDYRSSTRRSSPNHSIDSGRIGKGAFR
jgi:hypothetical protein